MATGLDKSIVSRLKTALQATPAVDKETIDAFMTLLDEIQQPQVTDEEAEKRLREWLGSVPSHAGRLSNGPNGNGFFPSTHYQSLIFHRLSFFERLEAGFFHDNLWKVNDPVFPFDQSESFGRQCPDFALWHRCTPTSDTSNSTLPGTVAESERLHFSRTSRFETTECFLRWESTTSLDESMIVAHLSPPQLRKRPLCQQTLL